MEDRLTWLGSLSSLINQYSPEPQLAQPRVTRSDASTADHVRGGQDFLLALPDQGLVFSLIIAAQLSLFVLELDQLLQLNVHSAVGNLLMQGEETDAAIESFSGFGGETDDLQSGGVDLFRQLVDGDVRRCADKNLARVHLGQMIDDRGRGDGLASTRRTLNETKRLLQHALDRIHLRVVEFRKSRR